MVPLWSFSWDIMPCLIRNAWLDLICLIWFECLILRFGCLIWFECLVSFDCMPDLCLFPSLPGYAWSVSSSLPLSGARRPVVCCVLTTPVAWSTHGGAHSAVVVVVFKVWATNPLLSCWMPVTRLTSAPSASSCGFDFHSVYAWFTVSLVGILGRLLTEYKGQFN